MISIITPTQLDKIMLMQFLFAGNMSCELLFKAHVLAFPVNAFLAESFWGLSKLTLMCSLVSTVERTVREHRELTNSRFISLHWSGVLSQSALQHLVFLYMTFVILTSHTHTHTVIHSNLTVYISINRSMLGNNLDDC